MSTIVKKTMYITVSLAALLFCTTGILLSFVFGDNLQSMVNSLLKIKVYEPYIGGKIITSIFDPMHDDKGSGTAVYPANSIFEEGNLDLVLYTVHEPVYHAPWQVVPEYWQLDLEFRTGFKDAHNPEYNRTIYVYVDIDNGLSGSIDSLFEQGENISFNPEHPWDYAIAVTGQSGFVYNGEGKKIDSLEVVYSIDGKKVIVRVPLTKKELQKMYAVPVTHHYVLVGAYSPLDHANLLPLSKRKSRTSGGGLVSTLMPKIYDILFDGDQSEMLSSWNDETFEFAQINPVFVSMQTSKNESVSVSQKRIQEIEQELEMLLIKNQNYQTEKKESLLNQKNPSLEIKEELALLALATSDRLTAEKLFNELLQEAPNNPTYIAYLGSLESMKGANASVVAAVEAVNKGYMFLDKAVVLTDGTFEKVKNGTASYDEIQHRYNALLNRGGNSQSVPNTVFLKAAQGAHDYLEAAEIARLSKSSLLAARCYYDAAICFSLDNKQNDAAVWKRESARIVRSMEDTDSLSLEDKISLRNLQLNLLKEGLLE